MNNNNKTIKLRPNIWHWITKATWGILIMVAILALKTIYPQYYAIYWLCLIGFGSMSCYLFYSFIALLICTRWEVTPEQIKIYKGIFIRAIDYIELYRIYDYKIKRSLTQVLTGNSNIYIYSGDKSHPILKIEGIKDGISILQLIRNRVEFQKQIKGVYEFTNK